MVSARPPGEGGPAAAAAPLIDRGDSISLAAVFNGGLQFLMAATARQAGSQAGGGRSGYDEKPRSAVAVLSDAEEAAVLPGAVATHEGALRNGPCTLEQKLERL